MRKHRRGDILEVTEWDENLYCIGNDEWISCDNTIELNPLEEAEIITMALKRKLDRLDL